MDFGELVRQFVLGNQAILTNVCMLPLYPGLIAFLAGNVNNDKARRATNWLGIIVLAGVLTMMIFIGFLLHLFSLVTGDILRLLLPVVYVVVIGMGLLLLSGNNPFARMSTVHAPILNSPYSTAYVYGVLLAPMTLPCTGVVIANAFLLGAGSATGLLAELVYFLAFGMGFGWPLVVLPFLAAPAQRRFTQALANNHVLLNRASGTILVAIGVLGIITEVIPNTTVV